MKQIALLFLLAASASASGATSITPNTISQQISTLGAKAALQAIYDNKTTWAQLLAGIASGTKDWLLIADQLRRVSDAGTSEQLGLAVGEALERRPENVLSLGIAEFGVETVCGAPDVDDVRFDSYNLLIP